MNPRLRLANLPTPVELLPRLSAFMGGPRIWIKRDDLTGAAMGGNKVRKLEFLLAEAQANGAKTLVTTGAAQSNHARQTAGLAAKLGFKCVLVLSREGDEPVEGNLILDHLFGAEVIWTSRESREETLQETFRDLWGRGERPYLIPLGGSNPTGTLGYQAAFDEFLAQEPGCNWTILATSSGGTQAGLELGKRWVGWDGQILGINVGSDYPDLPGRVAMLCKEASERAGKPVSPAAGEIMIQNDYCASGYGNPGEQEIQAIRRFAALEGIILDPVYTARAAAGMFDLVRNGFFKPTDSLLFWHTGGAPAVFTGRYAKQLL